MKNFLVPLSIIIAGVFVAGAIVYSDKIGEKNNDGDSDNSGNTANNNGNNNNNGDQNPAGVDNIKPVTNEDHIRGDINAPVVIVEFSDLECPFCKRFHETMQRVINEYGKNKQVAWVYRHFPLDSLHPKARKEAEATECANELGGNTKFWEYADRLLEVTPSNNGLDADELPNIAEFVGLDRAKFEQCLSSGKYAQHVSDDLADATNSGGQGTPYSVVVTKNGSKFVINGAQPYENVKQTIDNALKATASVK